MGMKGPKAKPIAALFKMNPKVPFMKALVGKQGNLPQQLQDAIKDAPEAPAKMKGVKALKK